MTIEEQHKIMKSSSIEDELVIIEIMRMSIKEARFLELLHRYKINKCMLSACMPDLKEKYYDKWLLLEYSNEYNKPIINEVYDKYEIFA